MTADRKDKKRKAPGVSTAASTGRPPLKKSKKTPEKSTKVSVDNAKPLASKAAGTSDSVKKGNSNPKKEGLNVDKSIVNEPKPRKRAADFLDDEKEAKKEKVEVNGDKQPKKKTKSEKSTAAVEKVEPPVEVKSKKSKQPKKDQIVVSPVPEPSSEDEPSVSDAESDDDEDDRTMALVKGFESEDEGSESESDDVKFKPGQDIPNIPDPKKVSKKIRKQEKEEGQSGEPGVVYVGRVPHGFYEHEMRAYFSQFGTISKLRLSRNRVTGRSKHYAFIEFTTTSVAKVVADTMDNYLMFGHILKCKFVPNDKLHEDIWKGANRRFKVTPWNKIERQRLESGKTREKWAEAVTKEEKKRAKRAEKMKAIGYEYSPPKLRAVDDVPVREEQGKLEETSHIEIEAEKDTSSKEVTVAEEEAAEKPVSKASKKKKAAAPKEDTTPAKQPAPKPKAEQVLPVNGNDDKKSKKNQKKEKKEEPVTKEPAVSIPKPAKDTTTSKDKGDQGAKAGKKTAVKGKEAEKVGEKAEKKAVPKEAEKAGEKAEKKLKSKKKKPAKN
ncbi:hypothetical protein FQN57_000318 [Myotisia sp. PD_48]|nr:hypothetical protein FQN57_000318 [Myotisia sp. PD_48]